MSAPNTITVTGQAVHRQPPSFALLSGLFTETNSTLSLAIERLVARRKATAAWLERLKATEVRFLEPRFPSQAEPSVMDIARARMRKRGSGGTERSSEVVMQFTALWPVQGMSPEEILVFVDGILFEATAAEDPDDAPKNSLEAFGFPDGAAEEENFGQHMAEMMGKIHERMEEQLSPPKQDTHILFLTKLGESDRLNLLDETITDARRQATEIANSVNRQVGDVVSIDDTAFVPGRSQRELWKHNRNFLNDLPYGDADNEVIAMGPKEAEFHKSLRVSFELKPV